MLTKDQRISKKKDFDYIFSNGRSRYSNLIGVKFVTNGLTFNRFGLIISNKVSKKAVDRNRLRRRLYSQIAALLSSLKVSYDIVIIVQPIAKDMTSLQINKELTDLLKSAKLNNEL